MKATCDIIRDLLPLYKDGVCSDESKKAVNEHLENCENCKAEFDLMNTEILSDGTEIKKDSVLNAAVFARKKIKSKAFIKGCVIAVSVIAFLALAAVGSYCGYHYFNSIDVEDERTMFNMADEYVDKNNVRSIDTVKKGDYLAVFYDVDIETDVLLILERDKLFKERWSVEGVTYRIISGEIGCWCVGQNGEAILVYAGRNLPEEGAYYQFYNSGGIHIFPIENNKVLDIFIFADTYDITSSPYLLDKDKNIIKVY